MREELVSKKNIGDWKVSFELKVKFSNFHSEFSNENVEKFSKKKEHPSWQLIKIIHENNVKITLNINKKSYSICLHKHFCFCFQFFK